MQPPLPFAVHRDARWRRRFGLFAIGAALLVTGACCPHDVAVYAAVGGNPSYAEPYHDYLQADLGESFVRVTIGEHASTAAALAAAIRDEASIIGALSMARVVTIAVGEHEFSDARSQYRRRQCGGVDNQDCLRAMVALFDRYWADVSAGVLRHVPRAAAVRAMDLHHAWVNEDRNTNTVDDDREREVRGSDFEVLRDYLQQLNASIRHHAAAWNIGVADTYGAINGPFGTDDPIAVGYIDEQSRALTTKGQERIALALRRLGYAATPEAFTLDGR
ncbi:MAG TPA: hypothetical protein VFV51_14665 [Vicinamibacterales bacterium]|nr:hypothetical protein [Vicinamibacterales bacterium]